MLSGCMAAPGMPQQEIGCNVLTVWHGLHCELGMKQERVPRVQKIVCPKFCPIGHIIPATTPVT